MRLAINGNYQPLRNVYFKFRMYCKIHYENNNTDKKKQKGAINYESKLTFHDSKFTKDEINHSPRWTNEQALRLYGILEKFQSQLNNRGVELPVRPTPRTSLLTYQKQSFYLYLDYSFYKRERGSFHSAIDNNSKKFDRENSKAWIIDAKEYSKVFEFCQKHGIDIGQGAKDKIDNSLNSFSKSYSFKRVDIQVTLKNGMSLRDYQTVGVDYGMKNERILNADDMGLGKSVQSIVTICAIPQPSVCLLICPKSLIYNWVDEIHKWTDKKVFVLNHKNIKTLEYNVKKGYADFVIINYEGVKTFFCDKVEDRVDSNGKKYKYVKMNSLCKLFNSTIIDEGHNLKNEKTDKHVTVKKAIEHMRYRILLTGTPIVNKIDDIWALIVLLGRETEFGGKFRFKKTYKELSKKQDKKENKNNQGISDEGKSMLANLNDMLRSICMIRREKKNVAKELPEKILQDVYVDIDNWDEYSHALINLESYISQNMGQEKLESAMRAKVLAQINILSQISERGKIGTAKEFIDNLLLDGKLVIFTWYKSTIKKIQEIYPTALEVSGDIDDLQVRNNVKKFQEDPKIKVIALTYKKGSTGLTLTSASNWLCTSLPWTPADFDQAVDRVHRIGQKNTVNAFSILGRSTIDQYKYEIIKKKRELFNNAVDSSSNNDSLQKELIDFVMSGGLSKK